MKLSAAGGNGLVSDVAAEEPADWLSACGSGAMKAMATGEKEEVIGWDDHMGAGHVLEFFWGSGSSPLAGLRWRSIWQAKKQILDQIGLSLLHTWTILTGSNIICFRISSWICLTRSVPFERGSCLISEVFLFPPVISPWFLIKGRWKRFRGGPQIFGFTEEQKGKVGYVKG